MVFSECFVRSDESDWISPRQQTHSETLRGPERQDDVVADEQTGLGGGVRIRDGH